MAVAPAGLLARTRTAESTGICRHLQWKRAALLPGHDARGAESATICKLARGSEMALLPRRARALRFQGVLFRIVVPLFPACFRRPLPLFLLHRTAPFFPSDSNDSTPSPGPIAPRPAHCIFIVVYNAEVIFVAPHTRGSFDDRLCCVLPDRHIPRDRPRGPWRDGRSNHSYPKEYHG